MRCRFFDPSSTSSKHARSSGMESILKGDLWRTGDAPKWTHKRASAGVSRRNCPLRIRLT